MPEVKSLLDAQVLTGVGSTPAQFKAYLDAEIVRWAKIVQTTGAQRE